MNAVKIRAWNPSTKTMIYPIEGDLIIVNEKGELEYWYGATKCIVMFFTGLLDKQGKEIYEGDIIEAFEGDYTAEIVWYEDQWKAVGWALKLKNSTHSIQTHFLPFYEVIGNVWENPELLEVKE